MKTHHEAGVCDDSRRGECIGVRAGRPADRGDHSSIAATFKECTYCTSVMFWTPTA